MGLDMSLYLKKHQYVSRLFNDTDKPMQYPDDIVKFFPELGAACEENNGHIITNTYYEVGYWRKANHIHGWIIKNVANDVDEGQEILLTEKDCEELLWNCKAVLRANQNKPENEATIIASSLLPRCPGFFFGSQEYDEWYYKEIEDTIKVLQNTLDVIEENRMQFEMTTDVDVLKTIPSYEIIYQASW